jgi:hypothetical protein
MRPTQILTLGADVITAWGDAEKVEWVYEILHALQHHFQLRPEEWPNGVDEMLIRLGERYEEILLEAEGLQGDRHQLLRSEVARAQLSPEAARSYWFSLRGGTSLLSVREIMAATLEFQRPGGGGAVVPLEGPQMANAIARARAIARNRGYDVPPDVMQKLLSNGAHIFLFDMLLHATPEELGSLNPIFQRGGVARHGTAIAMYATSGLYPEIFMAWRRAVPRLNTSSEALYAWTATYLSELITIPGRTISPPEFLLYVAQPLVLRLRSLTLTAELIAQHFRQDHDAKQILDDVKMHLRALVHRPPPGLTDQGRAYYRSICEGAIFTIRSTSTFPLIHVAGQYARMIHLLSRADMPAALQSFIAEAYGYGFDRWAYLIQRFESDPMVEAIALLREIRAVKDPAMRARGEREALDRRAAQALASLDVWRSYLDGSEAQQQRYWMLYVFLEGKSPEHWRAEIIHTLS